MTALRPHGGGRPAALALQGSIRFYQFCVRPLLAPSCRFVPSCSEYALQAIAVHGAGRGSLLAAARILRCSPLHAGGHDPVPAGRCACSHSSP